MKRTAVLAVLTLALSTLASASAKPSASAQPEGAPALTLEPVATLASPIALATRAGTDDLYVAEREGRVRVLHVTGTDVTLDPTPLLDITRVTTTNGERGLLGLAFNPQGTRLFVHYSNPHGDTRVVEYQMSGGGHGDAVRLGTRRVVLGVDQPFSNHNGGELVFGPDGRLYLALGDGGGAGDPLRTGQNRRVLLGKVLRIDPNQAGSRPYTAPASNPYFNQPPKRKAIWLYGVRNPWRISFDQDTGDLYVADVGQGTSEEINVLPAGGSGLNAGRGANLGWSRMEGDQPFGNRTEPPNHTPPTVTYPHTGGRCAIVGGYVYRGAALPALEGTYVYGDFCTGGISGVVVEDGVITSTMPDLGVDVGPFSLLSFGQDADGEVYVFDETTVYRLDPA
jgi:glucose/arabinose dehydrogenase